MKPTLNKRLEELLDETAVEEVLAVIEAEQEVQRTFSPYRTDIDLSYRLNLPRDVQGLVELLEEKKKLKVKFKPISLDAIASAVVGTYVNIIGTTIAWCTYGVSYGFNNTPYLLFLTSLVSGPTIGYFLGKNNEKKAFNKFEKQEKANTPLIEAIEKKLSHYETKPSHGDIILTTQKPRSDTVKTNLPGDHWLGQVYMHNEESALYQTFVEPAFGSQITKRSEFEPEKVIAVLRPREYLSSEDIKALSQSGAAVVFEDKNDTHPGWPQVYGFLEEAKLGCLFDSLIGLYADSGHKNNSGHLITASEEGVFCNGKLTPRILVPEIKFPYQ